MRTLPTLLLPVLLASSGASTPDPVGDPPVELGAVRWGRDLDQALAEAGLRPVFALFQEIPGCATCVGFGRGPLSHPLLVEAIEDEFVPVAVHNNRPGRDAEWLERFGEPSWNNPVVRFLDSKGRDVIRRRDRVWSTAGIAARMVEALEEQRRPVPAYLELVVRESDVEQLERAVFAMHCFWQGEAKLGGLEGVVSTRPAHLDGLEVVEVRFHAPTLKYERLVKEAERLDCAVRVFATDGDQLERARAIVGSRAVLSNNRPRDAAAGDRLRALGRSRLRHLPLTPAQATRLNSALAFGGDPDAWLSPRQRELALRLAATEAERLEGLERPTDVALLPAYARELDRRLARPDDQTR